MAVIKCSLFLVIVGAALVRGFSEEMMKHSQEFMKHANECKDEVKATEADLHGLMSNKRLTTKTEACMLGCLLEKIDIIDDGKYMPETVARVAKGIMGDDCPVANLIGKMAKYCEKDVASAGDRCDMAKAMYDCDVALVNKFADSIK